MRGEAAVAGFKASRRCSGVVGAQRLRMAARREAETSAGDLRGFGISVDPPCNRCIRMAQYPEGSPRIALKCPRE